MLELRVLGGLGLWTEEGEVTLPIRRAQALVAYLALEGPQNRDALGELFWGDMDETRARANLRMALHKLRLTPVGAHLRATPREVGLLGEVRVDVRTFRERLARGDVEGALPLYAGPFLHGVELGGSEVWEAWVHAERERAQEVYHSALLGRAARLEAEGDWRGALDLHLELLAADELEEGHHRNVIRLHYLLGDRGAALRAFHRCRDLLRGELGLAPLEATLSLARLVEAGGTLPGTPPRPALPASVLRPPRLIGRDDVWDRMGAAWADGRAVVLSGEPGVGKSRLAADFAGAHGRSVVCAGRPGDDLAPYSTLTRALRALWTEAPDLALPPAVRAEVARVMPEWGEAPGPMGSAQDRARFLQALGTVFEAALDAGVRAVVVDDLQFADDASVEALLFAHERHWGRAEGALRTLYAFRPGELGAAVQAHLDRAEGAGLAVRVTLGPLQGGQVGELVHSLGLTEFTPEQLGDLGREIARFAAGNPQWVLETLKSALESGAPPAWAWSEALSRLLARRLARLSPGARQLARVLAVAGVDVDLAARVLEVDVLALLGPLVELERAQVVAGGGFAHDLLYEAVLGDLPGALRAALHKRCALHLAPSGADPGRVAHHWSEAGDSPRAAPHWFAAGQAAEGKYLHAEAAELYRRASEAFMAAGDRRQELEALKKHADLLRTFDLGPRYAAAVDRLLERANTPYLKAGAWQTKAYYLHQIGQGDEAETAARAGYEQAELSGDLRQRTTLLNMLAVTFWQQRRLGEAERAFERTLALCAEWGEAKFEADTWVNLGVVQSDRQEYARALSSYGRALGKYREAGDLTGQAHVLANSGAMLRERGAAAQAVPRLLAALELYRSGQPMPDYERRVLTQLAKVRRDLGHLSQALAAVDEAGHLAARGRFPAARVHEVRGEVLLWLGALEEARGELDTALGLSAPGDPRGRVLLKFAWWAAWSGDGDGAEAVRRAGEALRDTQDAPLRVQLALLEGHTLSGARGVQCLARALELAGRSDLAGLEVRVRAYLAMKLLEVGQAPQALGQARRARERLGRVCPTNGSEGEVRLAHVLALRAAGREEAEHEHAALRAWVLQAAEGQVPEERRPGFLRRNPVNRAALAGGEVLIP